ncbi:MAG: hypothetical protein H8D43_03635, partial [Chloroflexi bacterium]|nr:hypothetical protein [Chloroflexota bacterium]
MTAPHPVHPLNHLHQTFGNRAVGNLIQAKLRIGQPGDRYEREADRVADQVMRMPAPAVQRQESEQPEEEEEGKESSIQPKLVYSSAPALQRQEATEEEEEEEPTEGTVQPKRISSTPLTLQRQEAPEEEEEEPDEGAIQPKLVSPALLTLQRQEAPKEEEEELTEGSIQPKLISSACPTLQRQEAPEEEEEEESGAGTIQPKSVSSHTPTLSPSKRTCTQNPFGNPVIGRFIQGKLKIDQPGDRYEREADQVADMAMRMPGAETAKSEVVQHREEKPHEEEHQVRCKPLGQQITPLIQRQFEQERGNVQ